VLEIGAIPLLLLSTNAQSREEQAYRAEHWTSTDKAEYEGCVSRLTAKRADTNADPWCEMWEERQRWLRAHPEAKGRKWNSPRFRSAIMITPHK
jgi:hypothetical protein